MVFNQGFVPGWNVIYPNLITKVGKTIITSNHYTSPFSSMVADLECGQYVEDIHLNLGTVLLHDTVINSDIFHDYHDDLAVGIYECDTDLQFPSTYTEHVVRLSFSVLQNVSELISALTANIRTTLEFHRNRLVKQMLYNGVEYGMIQCVKIGDPTMNKENAGRLAITFNTLVDDFKTEINPRYVPYNLQVGITPTAYRQTITRDIPYVIAFNNYIRDVEFNRGMDLGWIGTFASGDKNDEWQRRMIRLNADDFPTSIPPKNRSAVTGDNVRADDINFFEMPKDGKTGDDLFPGTRQGGGDTIAGFVIDPEALKLYTQLDIKTAWMNPATLSTTNREIYRGIMQLGAFNKIAAVTFDKGVA